VRSVLGLRVWDLLGVIRSRGFWLGASGALMLLQLSLSFAVYLFLRRAKRSIPLVLKKRKKGTHLKRPFVISYLALVIYAYRNISSK